MDCQHHPLLEEPHTAPDVDPHDSVDLAEDAEDAEDAQESSSRTLWVGDVEHWMDEEFLHRCFSPIGSVTNIKLVRRTNLPSSGGFAFVEFADRAPVADAVDRLEGRAFHALGFNFRVNWAQFSVNDSNLANRNGSGASRGTEYSIYVGGLDFAVKDHDLLNAFMSRYPSAFQAKVICDQHTQFSRGFGFVRFREQREAEEAIREMQGVFIGSKAIKVKQANRSQEALRVRRERPELYRSHGIRFLHRVPASATAARLLPQMVPVIDSMAVTTVLCISQLDAATPQDPLCPVAKAVESQEQQGRDPRVVIGIGGKTDPAHSRWRWECEMGMVYPCWYLVHGSSAYDHLGRFTHDPTPSSDENSSSGSTNKRPSSEPSARGRLAATSAALCCLWRAWAGRRWIRRSVEVAGEDEDQVV
ncbi:unnamed protein product [Durusdinium trenchii]|uniref:RRM domain-containing protein n=1 Tax=Durusdinium trenchii TaxID=1381693 RepID=A0ABP0P1L3_9DINO